MTLTAFKNGFKEEYGKPFYQLYMEKRMEHAKALLLEGLSAAKVAELVGYAQPIKFNKTLFKFSLARSKISSKGLWTIIPKLPLTINHLNLSGLKITEKTLILMNDWFDNQTVGVL